MKFTTKQLKNMLKQIQLLSVSQMKKNLISLRLYYTAQTNKLYFMQYSPSFYSLSTSNSDEFNKLNPDAKSETFTVNFADLWQVLSEFKSKEVVNFSHNKDSNYIKVENDDTDLHKEFYLYQSNTAESKPENRDYDNKYTFSAQGLDTVLAVLNKTTKKTFLTATETVNVLLPDKADSAIQFISFNLQNITYATVKCTAELTKSVSDNKSVDNNNSATDINSDTKHNYLVLNKDQIKLLTNLAKTYPEIVLRVNKSNIRLAFNSDEMQNVLFLSRSNIQSDTSILNDLNIYQNNDGWTTKSDNYTDWKNFSSKKTAEILAENYTWYHNDEGIDKLSVKIADYDLELINVPDGELDA